MPLNALVDYDAHKARRKLWDAGFSQKSLKSFGPLFNRHLDELCTELGKREGLTDAHPIACSGLRLKWKQVRFLTL